MVRSGKYQNLDLKISEALKQRSSDFPGVVICTASDSLGTLLQLIKKRRVHRLVVVEGEVSIQFLLLVFMRSLKRRLQEEERRGGKKGRLLGIITLSDVLQYIMGAGTIAEGNEPKSTQQVETVQPPVVLPAVVPPV